MRNYEMTVSEAIHGIRDAGKVPDLENMLYDLEMCPEGYRSDYDDLPKKEREQVIAEVTKEIKSRFRPYSVVYINPFFTDKKEQIVLECVNEDDAEEVVKGMEHTERFAHARLVDDVVSVEKRT